eukprot:365458-Chlamydomonas_euryale.AAC.12
MSWCCNALLKDPRVFNCEASTVQHSIAERRSFEVIHANDSSSVLRQRSMDSTAPALPLNYGSNKDLAVSTIKPSCTLCSRAVHCLASKKAACLCVRALYCVDTLQQRGTINTVLLVYRVSYVECRLYRPLLGSDTEPGLGRQNKQRGIQSSQDCRTLHVEVPHLANAWTPFQHSHVYTRH